MSNRALCSVTAAGKLYGSIAAVEDVSLSLQEGELISIIGPSGAGKTTLLRMIAGLEPLDAGSLQFTDPPTRENPVVLVFQDFMLFPGMTIARNIGFGLRARHMARTAIEQRVSHLLQVFGIADKADAYPNQLSAGQQQRVALARALAVQPRILLLDEPFAHLDKTLKMDTALYLRRIHEEFGTTTMTVTHDLEEAFAMSDRVGIMIDGRLVQLGSVDEVYAHPVTVQAAEFLGPVNRFTARWLNAMRLNPSATAATADLPGDTRLYCRAESMAITPDPEGKGTVEAVTFIGILVLYRVRLDVPDDHPTAKTDSPLLSIFSLEDGLHPGTRVRVQLSRCWKEGKHSECKGENI